MNAHTATVAERPVAFQGDLANLPDAMAPLKALPNWVCWKWEWKVDKRGVGKWTKPPLQPRRPRKYAKNNDPSTWGTYDEALAVFTAGQCDGIGFALLGTQFAAFDLDKCRDPASGAIAEEAQAIVDRAASYTELTVSGTGLRVIGLGNGSEIHRKQKVPNSSVEVESYSNTGRYIVISGNPLPGVWPHIADISGSITAVVDELGGERVDQNQPVSDAGEVLDFNKERRQRSTSFLPDWLRELIETPVPLSEDHSRQFYKAVCKLWDWGWPVEDIQGYIADKPIVPERYRHRLRKQIEDCLRDANEKVEAKGKQNSGQGDASRLQAPIELFWHGDRQDQEARAWLIDKLLPETGAGLMSGQWGTAKTFVAVDISASVMTATPFAGRAVSRRGGVLFVAAEGAGEIPIRLTGVVEQKLRPTSLAAGATGNPLDANLDRLPFAWIEECPPLKDDDAFGRLVAAALQAAANIKEQFDLPLVLIVIDTLNAAANFKDGNDAAEGQLVMNRLQELSRRTGALTLAVDHFGKAVETGTRGTSAKEAAADFVLALLAERDTAGTISNTRMAVRKLRAGSTGSETPFNLKTVRDRRQRDDLRHRMEGGTRTTGGQTAHKERWTKSLRLFRSAMRTALTDHGKVTQPYGNDGPTVRTVAVSAVRAEFMAAYVAGEDDKANTKRKAFARALKTARERRPDLLP